MKIALRLFGFAMMCCLLTPLQAQQPENIMTESGEPLQREKPLDDITEKRITFSIPGTAGDHGGDTVEYVTNGDDRTFTWDQQSAGVNHLVTWNHATNEGSITASNFRRKKRRPLSPLSSVIIRCRIVSPRP